MSLRIIIQYYNYDSGGSDLAELVAVFTEIIYLYGRTSVFKDVAGQREKSKATGGTSAD